MNFVVDKTMKNISIVFNKQGKLKANAYFITSTSIISTAALNWLNANEIKLLKESDKDFLEALKVYMISAGLIKDLPKEVVQKKKTILM